MPQQNKKPDEKNDPKAKQGTQKSQPGTQGVNKPTGNKPDTAKKR